MAFLRADLNAHGVGSWRIHYRLTRPTLHFQRLLRRVEYLQSRHDSAGRIMLVPARIRLARASVRLGLSIPPGVFARGLSIAHYGSIVVNDKARIGRYCRIHSSTNIGEYAGGAPTIGDYAYIGPGAVIYGGIYLGNEIVIGANSVVGTDYVGSVTLGGAPAKVISQDGSRRLMPEWMQNTKP